MVGIILAMEEELMALKEYMTDSKEYNIFDVMFYEGYISGVHTILALSGIGKVNAARTTQILIDNMQVDYIFNVGVAGGVSPDIKVLDIVVGEKMVQHDFDLTGFNHEKGYIPNIDDVYIESDLYLRNIALSSLSSSNVYTGVIASGDIFCTDKLMEQKINNKFKALCVEMEGASIAQVCYLSHIPFLVIRSISDTLMGDNSITYDEFLEKSSSTIASAMVKILAKLKDDNDSLL